MPCILAVEGATRGLLWLRKHVLPCLGVRCCCCNWSTNTNFAVIICNFKWILVGGLSLERERTLVVGAVSDITSFLFLTSITVLFSILFLFPALFHLPIVYPLWQLIGIMQWPLTTCSGSTAMWNSGSYLITIVKQAALLNHEDYIRLQSHAQFPGSKYH